MAKLLLKRNLSLGSLNTTFGGKLNCFLCCLLSTKIVGRTLLNSCRFRSLSQICQMVSMRFWTKRLGLTSHLLGGVIILKFVVYDLMMRH